MPRSARAQSDVERLAGACSAASTTLAGPCLEAALALQAAHGAVGLAVSGGSDLPGHASTLGRRLGSSPRFALGARVGLTRADLIQPSGEAPARSGSSWIRNYQASLAAGVFDGFSAAPTVGGILALDVFATAFGVALPDDRGFQGSTAGFGLGARLGILRESFTLPGVTLSVARRWVGEVEVGNADIPDPRSADFDVTVTSLRAALGKDLLAISFVAGIGWDRYRSDARVRVSYEGSDLIGGPLAGGPPGVAEARNSAFGTERTLFFGSASYTFLVLQLSAEGGYARGFEAVPGRASGGYDPAAGSVFVRLGARLTL
ncbi:MAG TPA: hypothetical protein VGA70_04435 [Longimicrobiales bacterium]